MRHHIQLSVLIAILLLMLVGPGTSQADPPKQDRAAPVKLRSTTFVPTRGERPSLPAQLIRLGFAEGRRGYYIVQFRGPIEPAWKDQVAALGGELLDYLPEFAFKVRMTPAQSRQVNELDVVSWVGVFQPAYKLSPRLVRNGIRPYTIRLERGIDANQVANDIAGTGAQILRRNDDILLVAANSPQIDSIVQIADVAWVENFTLYEKHNEYGAGVIMEANAANANGYDGSSQIVAVADTGLGDGTASGAHPDIPAGRITAIFNWTTDNVFGCYRIFGDGPQDVDSGHGTHVAVSVLGGGGPGGEAKGTAPEANLVFQAIEDYARFTRFCSSIADGYYLLGIPENLQDLYQEAYDAGARIHSNSWGSDAAGDYTLDSANSDTFIWNNPDMTITFSAGNAGADANLDGIVDNDSIGSPATAKNVITVGASENDRDGDYSCDQSLSYVSSDSYQSGETCTSMGGNNILGTAGERWDFTVEPLNSDISAGNAEQMAPFSSRGPTDDGRIKPDIVAPGTWVLSGYSALYQEGFGDPVNPQNGVFQSDGWGMPLDETHKYFGGTSMSNPLTAGAAAVVRDFYQKAHGHAASAALVKATLINSAVDLLDENNDGADDNDFPIPNFHEGWGRVNVLNATDNSHQFVEETTGLGTSETNSYQFDLTGGSSFKVSLVWSDFPSTETAAQNLVNDLDLIVTAPGGLTEYRGNVFSGGWSQTGGGADRVNNVENVYIQSAEAGTWTVEVMGFNVPSGPQPYALVIDGSFGTGDNPPAINSINPADGATVSGNVAIEIDASDTEDAAGALTVEWNIDGGAWQAATYNSSSGLYEANWDSTTVGDGAHTLDVQVIDSANNTTTGSNNVTVDNVDEAPAINSITPADGATVSGNVAIEIDASDAEDAAGALTVEWNIDGGAWQSATHNGGSELYEANWDSTTVGDGSHTLNVQVIDSANNTTTGSNNITVDNATSGGTMHVGDLDGANARVGREWTATVTILVHDADHNPVADATVSGTWSFGAGSSCTTDGSGQCSITSDGMSGKVGSNTFTVGDVTHASLTYQSADNHDPDGDSDGTSIEVLRP